MFIKFRNFVCIFALSFFISGCSVQMALEGVKPKNIQQVRIGEDRDTVLFNLGQPVRSNKVSGRLIDEFELDRRTYVDAGRAVIYLALDVVTLGIWELVGVPLEDFLTSYEHIIIEYDEEDRVMVIR